MKKSELIDLTNHRFLMLSLLSGQQDSFKRIKKTRVILIIACYGLAQRSQIYEKAAFEGKSLRIPQLKVNRDLLDAVYRQYFLI